MKLQWILIASVTVMISCSQEKKAEKKTPARIINVPSANADSAYFFVKKQVDFGPRVPNSKPHRQTGDYLVSQLRKYGAEVTVQEFKAESFDGQQLALKNIIASFYPEKRKRIMLAAHWDTRPYADKDEEKPHAPFDGANDGASGVGVLLEIARVLNHSAAPEVGVDIILFDGEDWGFDGEPEEAPPLPPGMKDSWCIGSQYWATHKHKPQYAAHFGVLLDMVGAADAKFYKEGFSMEYAPTIVDRIWKRAALLGYSNVFVAQNVPPITDDHRYIFELGKIPVADVVHYDPALGFFGDFHHSRKDNMALISARTLQIVADVMLNVVYYEQ